MYAVVYVYMHISTCMCTDQQRYQLHLVVLMSPWWQDSAGERMQCCRDQQVSEHTGHHRVYGVSMLMSVYLGIQYIKYFRRRWWFCFHLCSFSLLICHVSLLHIKDKGRHFILSCDGLDIQYLLCSNTVNYFLWNLTAKFVLPEMISYKKENV